MTASHDSYEDLVRARRCSDEYRQGYAEAQRAFQIGRAVRERRLRGFKTRPLVLTWASVRNARFR